MNTILSALLIISVSALGTTPATPQDTQKIPRIGLLASGSPSTIGHQRHRQALLQGLEELGYVDGKNIIIEYRYANGKLSLLPELAADLIRLKVSVIIPTSSTALLPVLEATKSIPIVEVTANPRLGYIKSYAEPGGNVTGLSSHAEGLEAKRIEILKESFPGISRVMILDPPRASRTIPEYQRAAQALGIGLEPIRVRNREEFSSVFAKIEKMHPDALITIRNTLTYRYAQQIARFAVENRIPLFADDRYFVESGALMSFGVNYRANWRRAAVFVDKILKGANPATLPVEPPELELVINLKTAEKIGVTIPPEILLEANEVIK